MHLSFRHINSQECSNGPRSTRVGDIVVEERETKRVRRTVERIVNTFIQATNDLGEWITRTDVLKEKMSGR